MIIDEVAKVDDELYWSVRPMLAVSQGRIILLSTPFGKRGFFFKERTASTSWKKIQVTADQCPRISQDFLDEERATLGDWWFQQEYCCVFGDNLTSVFRWEDIQKAFAEDARRGIQIVRFLLTLSLHLLQFLQLLKRTLSDGFFKRSR